MKPKTIILLRTIDVLLCLMATIQCGVYLSDNNIGAAVWSFVAVILLLRILLTTKQIIRRPNNGKPEAEVLHAIDNIHSPV